ncbi:primase-helicase zinc-binding domain-containing protein [Arsenophonus sp.]|uniref:primase-helicase zinc-binding domain-containing protein n=1 Tax=Arsenophonus sp. TaxID=1872640 RepID=UPI003879736D
MRSFIDTVRDRANGNWETILPTFNIPINKKEGPCPACGGNTRYRFDDKEGRGTYFCSHCGPGTGLDLVMKVYVNDHRKLIHFLAKSDQSKLIHCFTQLLLLSAAYLSIDSFHR